MLSLNPELIHQVYNMDFLIEQQLKDIREYIHSSNNKSFSKQDTQDIVRKLKECKIKLKVIMEYEQYLKLKKYDDEKLIKQRELAKRNQPQNLPLL